MSHSQYDDEKGVLQVYDYKNKAWQNATYTECTIGVWNEGSYYITKNGTIVVINAVTGDWEIVTLSELKATLPKYFQMVNCLITI